VIMQAAGCIALLTFLGFHKHITSVWNPSLDRDPTLHLLNPKP